jgi:hypothetical protein
MIPMVRVPLQYGKRGLYVTGLLFNPRINTSKPIPVNFLIDTGATMTSIAPKDQFAMGVDPESMGLPRYNKKIITAGGKTSAFELRDSLICLVDEDDKPVNLEVQSILIMDRVRSSGKSLKKKEAVKINEMQPSIIGRDLLEKHGIILHSDFGKKIANLEMD